MRRSLAEAIHTDEIQPTLGSRIESGKLTPKEIVSSLHATALDAKGIEAVVLDVSKSSSLADYFMVLSGRSDRHVQGLARRLLENLEAKGIEPYSVQGMDEGHWVVIDTVDVVVHIFYEPLRDRYDLESLWLGSSASSHGAMPPGGTLKAEKRTLVPA